VGIFVSLLLAGSICGILFLSFKGKKPRSKNSSRSRNKSRYTRLEQNDQTFELRNAHTSSLMMSDSDSEDDEEIIIDTDDLPTDSRTLVSNGNLSKRNGINRTNTNPEIRA